MPAFCAAPRETAAATVKEILTACGQYRRGNDLVVPQHCHFIIGTRK